MTKPIKHGRTLTEVELEIMNTIWDLGECTVRDARDLIAKERELAYTSVATIMKILEQKKILKSYKKEKAHLYVPLISRNEYESTSLHHLKEQVFKGSPSSMVMRLLSDSKLSETDLSEIKQLINERLKS